MSFRQTFALVLALRIVALLFFKPGGSIVTSLGDIEFYQRLGELTLGGRLPFRDFWVEYPPLFPFVLTAIYKVAIHVPGWPSTTAPFQVMLCGFLLACDAVNVLLVRRIARLLHAPAAADAAALLYAMQPFAWLVGLGWFDPFPLVFLLGGLAAALSQRPALAGTALALGGLAKVIPLAIGPAVLRALASPRRILVAVLIGAAVTALVLVPLLATGSPFLEASLRATLSRSSWETPWALLEDYWGVGTVSPVPTRLQLAAAGQVLHPDVLPWTLISAVQGLLTLVLCFAPATPKRPRALVALATLSLLLTFFFNKGYSPQFLLYLLPLLAILWPGRRGWVYTLGLSALNLLEWPIVLSLFPDRHELIAAVIGVRAAAWLWLIVELSAEIWSVPARVWQAVRRPLAWAGGLAATAVLGWTLFSMGALLPVRGEQIPVLDYIGAMRPDASPGVVFASSRMAFYRLVPALGTSDTELALAASDADAAKEASREIPRDYWVVLDHSEGDAEARARLERELAKRGSRATDRWFGFYHVVGFVQGERWRAERSYVPIDAAFGDQLGLTGWAITRDRTIRPGSPLRVVLLWTVSARPKVDLKGFVHLLDASSGAIVTQEDRPVEDKGRLASTWSPGEQTVTALDVLVPPEAPAATLKLRIGLYDPISGERLRVGATDHLDLPGPTVVR